MRLFALHFLGIDRYVLSNISAGGNTIELLAAVYSENNNELRFKICSQMYLIDDTILRIYACLYVRSEGLGTHMCFPILFCVCQD